MRIFTLIAVAIASTGIMAAQSIGPDVTSWKLNTNGETGYDGIPTNVQKVQYSSANVYVSCTCIPGYDIGPWPGNPNRPVNHNFVFRITRTPQNNTGTPAPTPLGHIGVWTNGVSIFNAKDARSYNNGNVWHQNAILVERSSFDECLGHPSPNGEYHHHLNPRCLYDDRDSSRHSPIIGYAFDGFPVYGAYGNRNSDGTGGVTRMRSSYRLRAMADRTSLPGGTALPAGQHGPQISAQYPLGYYVEDFEYIAGLGDLDEHNGRFAITPEYPSGTYAYFVTLDENGEAAYPYTLGLTYKGIVTPGNTGPGSGHNVPGEPVVAYTVAGVERETWGGGSMYPNPASDYVIVSAPAEGGPWHASLFDLLGREVMNLGEVRNGAEMLFPLESLAGGTYLVHLDATGERRTAKLVVAK